MEESLGQTQQESVQDKVVHIARVAKVVKGGRRFSFSALVVAGDGRGKVGYGLGKAGEVPDAVRKAGEQGRKSLMNVTRNDNTIPYEVVGEYGSCKVIMYPAKKGRGIIAGGAVRIICELAGIKDIVCKIHGTKNTQNVVRAAFNGLMQLENIEQYAEKRGMNLEDIHKNLRGRKDAAAELEKA